MANLGLLFPLIFYTLVGFFGYSVYLTDTASDFLKSFKADYIGKPFFIGTYIAIILAVVMTYPIYFFEARNMWLYFIDIIIGRKELFSEQEFQDNMESRKKDILIEPLKKDEYVMTIVLFLLTMIAAYYIHEFDVIVVYTGATAGSLISLIIPGTLYLIMATK